MKVPNINVISSVVSSAGKHVNQVADVVSKHTSNPDVLTSALDREAYYAKIFCQDKKETIVSNYKTFIDNFKSGKNSKDFIVNGKNIARDIEILEKPGRLIDNYVPIYKSKEEAIENSLIGDVFQIQDDKAVSILNRKGKVEQLKMDRQSYFDMFPPLERFMSIQPSFGICYEITALNAVMENPKARENLLKCIDTVSKKGEIRVTFSNGNKSGHLVKPEMIDGGKEKDIYAQNVIDSKIVRACDGLRYIQYALGKEYEEPFIKDMIKSLKKIGDKDTAKTIKNMFDGKDKNIDGIKEIAIDYPNHKKDINGYKIIVVDKKLTSDEENEIKVLKNNLLSTDLRSAGDAIVPWRLMGFERNGTIEAGDYLSKEKPAKILIKDRKFLNTFKDENLVTSEKEFLDRLRSPEFFENHLVEAYVGNKQSVSDLEHWHSFRLAPILDDTGKIEAFALKNPHETTDKRVELGNILDKIDSISFARID